MKNKLTQQEIDSFVGKEVSIIHKGYTDYGKLTFCKDSNKWGDVSDRYRYCLNNHPYKMRGVIKINQIK